MKFAPLLAAFALAACAHGGKEEAPGGPPDVRLLPGTPAPPQAKLYADCLGEAAKTGSYVREAEGGRLRFSCTGSIAKSFYDGLASRSAEQKSEYVAEGRTWRFSNALIKNSIGTDGCSTDGKGDYACFVVLNVGGFLEQK